MGVAVFPNSITAPFIGGFIAVNGHLLLEYGMNALDRAYFSPDVWLGIVGPMLYFALIQYAVMPSVLARVCLVALHFVLTTFVDFNQVAEKLEETFYSTLDSMNAMLPIAVFSSKSSYRKKKY